MRRFKVALLVAGIVGSFLVASSPPGTAANAAPGLVAGCEQGIYPADFKPNPDTKIFAHCERNMPAPIPLANPVDITVQFSSVGSANSIALLMAIDKGEFKKENLNVTRVVVPGPDAMNLMAQEKIDVASNYDASLFNVIASGFKFTTPLSGWTQDPEAKDGMWCRKGVTFKNLKGKTLAQSNAATNAYISVYKGMQENHVKFSDIKLLNIANTADNQTAMINGQADCALTIAPFNAPLFDDDRFYFMAPFYVTGEPNAGVTFGPRMNRPEMRPAALAFIRAYVRTISTYFQGDYKRNPNVLADMARLSGAPAATLLATPGYTWDYVFRKGTMDRVQNMFQDLGALSYPKSKHIPEKKLYARSLLKDALSGATK